MMHLHDTLLAYSEWLDSQCLIVPEKESDDKRDLGTMVNDFVKEWEDDPRKATLTGRQTHTVTVTSGTGEEVSRSYTHSDDAEEFSLEEEDTETIDKGQHCTAEGCYTFSHTAIYCGKPQPRRCGCPFCYPS